MEETIFIIFIMTFMAGVITLVWGTAEEYRLEHEKYYKIGMSLILVSCFVAGVPYLISILQ